MKTLLSLATLLLLLATAAGAADLKLGYVDLQKALSVSEAGKVAKAKIESEIAAIEDQVQQRQSDLSALQESLKKQAALLAEEARRDKELEFQQQVKDYQRYVKDKQDEMRGKEAAYTQQILRDLGAQVVELCKKEKISMMMEKSQLVYASEALDFTDKLIEAYNRAYKDGHKK
ncbi:OmpH family outer membrane protein [Desulfuromonas thiophila]|mgnify:CR=1 FL=1|uniref:Periplasmic chaperone for outer membrane proteins Skp n=1 Tax=Desulfuromonas thiophila TaxID=57664 RepID=A0A1G7BU14_9BACT|nr:OmpH family outer membrane protein [Desulfuromonas thiophila]MDD3802205.1 OmpH family outer membrane protein [Desulfuromonas thiophila]SDE29685.1 periplasmic chaperone for outer membrane proteins Skp [Desulfuromonas thiophila]